MISKMINGFLKIIERFFVHSRFINHSRWNYHHGCWRWKCLFSFIGFISKSKDWMIKTLMDTMWFVCVLVGWTSFSWSHRTNDVCSRWRSSDQISQWFTIINFYNGMSIDSLIFNGLLLLRISSSQFEVLLVHYKTSIMPKWHFLLEVFHHVLSHEVHRIYSLSTILVQHKFSMLFHCHLM